jgi:ubiquinone/menaquinone biosynthesis C-methylase UbiE
MGPKRKAWIANLVKSNGIQSVLELGCCSGGNLKSIRKECGDIKLVGFDINETAIKYAQEIEHVDAEFVVGSLYDLSCFADKSFDLVFTCAVLVHLPESKVSGILSEMARISKHFVFNIEMNGKDYVMTESDGVPYAWVTDYKGRYEAMGLKAKTRTMESLIGNKDKIGVARDLVWCDLVDKELKI